MTSAWDIISGGVPVGSDVIVYDGTGRHPAPQVMELVVRPGRSAVLYSIDNQLAQELTYAERIIWKKRAYELAIPMHFDQQIERIERRGNGLIATFRNLATGATSEKAADQVIVEHGTMPADALYRGLRDKAANAGVTDLDALLAVRPGKCHAPASVTVDIIRGPHRRIESQVRTQPEPIDAIGDITLDLILQREEAREEKQAEQRPPRQQREQRPPRQDNEQRSRQRDDRPARAPQQQREQRPPRDEPRQGQVVGFGDDMPAFLRGNTKRG